MFSITWSNKRRSLFLRRYVNVLRISAILRIPKDVNVLRSSFVHKPGGMLSRRTFLRAVGASAGAALLAACGGATTTLGVYLSRVYAAASVPDELLEAARIDGSGEVRTFV